MFFTYLLGWSKTQKYYYGVRYKESATPESVGTTYFSSSKYVKQHIEEHGKPDIIMIRKIFNTKVAAKQWEEKVLRRLNCVYSDKWLNLSNNNSFRNIVMTDKIRKSISDARRKQESENPKYTYYTDGVINKRFYENEKIPDGWIKGKTKTEKMIVHVKSLNGRKQTKEHNEKISKALKGKPKPEGFGEKISIASKGKSKPDSYYGDNNVSKRPEVREKISKKLKGRKMYTDGNKVIFVHPENKPDGFYPTSIYHFNLLKSKSNEN